MTTILKAMSASEDSFLLPSAMAPKTTAASLRNELIKPSGSASHVPLSGYASVARAATNMGDQVTVDTVTELEEQRRAYQQEFEKRIKIAEDEARARGLKEGLLQGKTQGQKEWLDQVDQVKKMLITLGEQQRDFVATLEDELVALVFAGIVRIVGTVSASTASIKEVVRQAIAEDSGRLTVRIAPNDFDLLSTALKEISTDEIEIVPDPRVVLGGCLLESDRGTLDARLETQIEHIRKALLATRMRSVER